jgi:hypothetical protein
MKTDHEEPPMRYLCEARETGKPSFEFPTVDGDTARAVCDANGWELIRVYKKGGDSDRPAGSHAKGDPPLTPKQLQTLAIEAGKTHRALSRMALTTDAVDDWRHAEVWKCVRREGLSHCQNSHYRKLLAHFRTLRGEFTPGAPDKTSRQSREGGDTLERREQVLVLLAKELGHHARRVENPQTEAEARLAAHASTKGGVIGEDYLMALARAKNPGQTLHDTGCLLKLPASRLEQLLYTLRNRIAAREGRGDPKKRNKGQ